MYASQPVDRTITVTLADGTRTDATVIGTHPARDHTVLRLRVPAAKLVAPRPGATVSPPYFGVSLTGAGVVAAGTRRRSTAWALAGWVPVTVASVRAPSASVTVIVRSIGWLAYIAGPFS